VDWLARQLAIFIFPDCPQMKGAQRPRRYGSSRRWASRLRSSELLDAVHVASHRGVVRTITSLGPAASTQRRRSGLRVAAGGSAAVPETALQFGID
jgi:hypothetical protein